MKPTTTPLKRAITAATDGDDSNWAQTWALISIAESLEKLTEQLKGTA